MTSKRLTAGLVPYFEKNGTLYFFMQLRDAHAKARPGYLGFFGGGLEGGESPEAAIVREVHEELCIDISPSFFKTFELPERVLHVFLLEVSENFKDSVTILEGEDGLFLSETEMENHPKALDHERHILREVISHLRTTS